jgi:hypothetical protein
VIASEMVRLFDDDDVYSSINGHYCTYHNCDISMSFADELVIKMLPDGRTWLVVKEFSFHSPYHKDFWMTVPVGFKTDLASVPAIFQWIARQASGRHVRASVAHDYLYRNRIGTRLNADKCFLYLMKKDKVNFIKRHLLYYAVRTFGWMAWHG